MNKFDKPYRILPIFDDRKGLELFNIASKLDTHELLQYSLVNQIPLDYTNSDGECLIHEVINIDGRKASEHVKLNVIKFLIQNRVNPDKSNKNNQTPLHLACIQQLSVIIEYLLGLGVNPNFQDNMGNTPLHYLLTGLIKIVDTSTDVMDFIPPPKKQNLDLINKTIEIKQLLWKYIEDDKIDLPMMKSLYNTIDDVLKVDKDIVDRQLQTNNQIIKLASKTSSEDNSAEIKDLIQITKKIINDKLLRLFDNLPNLSNFEIHTKTKTSWSPIANSSLSLISDGNIKSVIKNDMNKISKEIIDIGDNFTEIKLFKYDWEEDGFKQLIGDFIKYFIKSKTNLYQFDTPNNYYCYKNEIDSITGLPILFEGDEFDKINDSFRHWLALDNASSIIDFDKLKYMGGPRQATIIDDDSWSNINYQLDKIKNNNWKENQNILSLLSYENLGTEIDKIDQNFIFLDNLDVFDTTSDFYNNILNKINQPTNPNYDIKYINDYCFYLIMSYTAIFNPNRFDEIKSIKPLGNMTLNFSNNLFAIKWFGIYKKNINLSSWIFGMISDINCKFSDSNLKFDISLNHLVTIAGLANNPPNKLVSIINAYKPHLIKHILDNENYMPLKLAKIIITLLNFNINKDFMDEIKKDVNTTIITITDDTTRADKAKQFINGLNITQELKELGTLLLDWYNYLSEYIKKQTSINFTTDNKLYEQYKNIGDNPENIIIKIILSLNEQSDNKLLNQTIIDLVYLVKNINTLNNTNLDGSISKFGNLSVLNWGNIIQFNLFNEINYDENLMPSEYSKLNYDMDDISQLGSSHLLISHIFGLHYIGMVYPTNYKLDNSYKIGDKSFFLSRYKNKSNKEYYHYFRIKDNKIGNGQLPFILNYLKLDNSKNLLPENKYYYYNISDQEFRIPTHNAYVNALIIKIKYYQTKINELIKKNKSVSVKNIVQEMITGKTNKLNKLYVKIYPKLALYSNILLEFINLYSDTIKHYYKDNDFNELNPIKLIDKPIENYDYIKLARGLNKINSNYYIYYYLYQPGKLVGLSRFNYYQIPVNFPTKYFYYNGDSKVAGDLVNIASDNSQTIPTLDAKILPTNDHVNQSTRLKMLNEGYINNFKIGNYSNILDDYTNMKLPTSLGLTKKDFVILKESSLPPSLFNALGDFYKYVLIEIVKKILSNIEGGKLTLSTEEHELWEKSNRLIKSTGIAIDQYDLTTYSFMMKLIQELIKEQLEIYINRLVIEKYTQFITNNNILLKSPIILPVKDMQVNLTFSSVKLDTIKKKENLKNMFSLVLQPPKLPIDPFILYPNDLSNINKLRSKYGVIINPKIVEIMLKSHSSPYATNAEGYSTIFPIIKNYNYKLIQTLKSNGLIDFRSFSESPLTFIQQENINNINKILDSIDVSNVNIKDLLGNIDGYLFNDVKSTITANELFGNNILLYLPESFNMSTYLTLQYLSESLDFNSNIDFNIIDFENIIGLINNSNISSSNLNQNFLGKNLKSLNVPDSIEHIIVQELLKEKKIEINQLIDEIKSLDIKDDEIKKKDIALHNKINIKSSTLYLDIKNKVTNLNNLIQNLEIINLTSKTMENISTSNTRIDIISEYETYNNLDKNIGPMIKAWSKLLESTLESNYNLIPIYILDKQKQLITDINPNKLGDLDKIEKVMRFWNLLAENYFSNKKYTENNPTLDFINKLLNYITKMIICNGIELMIRKVLMTWLLNASTTKTYDYDQINNIIQYILDSELTGKTDDKGQPTNMLKELYEVVCPNLVKNSAEIFKNKSDEQAHYVQNTKEILLNYFQLLDLTSWGSNIPNKIKDIFRIQVVNYFDTITSKSIGLWFVNVENILKFFINNYRCLKTMIELIK